jgi:hypothetical protein
MPLLSFLVLALFGILAGISLATQAAVNLLVAGVLLMRR